MRLKRKTILVALLALPSLVFGQNSVQESIDKLHTNAQALEDVVNGPPTGVDSDVALPQGGSQITVAKAIKGITDLNVQFQSDVGTIVAEAQVNAEEAVSNVQVNADGVVAQIVADAQNQIGTAINSATSLTLSTFDTSGFNEGDIVLLADGRYYEYRPNDAVGNVSALGGGFWNEIDLNKDMDNNKTAVIVLEEGQSNNVGWTAKNSFELSDYPLPNMYQLSKGRADSNYNAGSKYDLIPAYQPLQSTGSRHDGNYVSMGFYFAREMAKDYPQYDIYIVKNSSAATGFSNNRWNEVDDLRQRGTREVRLIHNELKQKYNQVFFAGLNMHQGETDADNVAHSSVYESKTVTKFNSQRNELSDLGFGDFPIVLGTMVSTWIGSNPTRLEVDAVHRNIANLIPNAGFVDLSDLTDTPDGVHFAAHEAEIKGIRYYEKWKTLNNFTKQSYEVAKKVWSLDAKGGILNSSKNYSVIGNAPKTDSDEIIEFLGGGLNVDVNFTPSKAYSKIVTFHWADNSVGLENLISGHIKGDTKGLAWYFNAGFMRATENGGNNYSYYSTNQSNINNFGEWITLALVFDGVNIYVKDHEGNVIHSIAESNRVDALVSNISVGVNNDTDGFLSKSVRYMATYTGVLTDGEIQEIHNEYSHFGIDTVSNMIAHYNFNANTNDVSGNGNNPLGTNSVSINSGFGSFTNTQYLEIPVTDAQAVTRVIKFRTSNDGYMALVSHPSSSGFNFYIQNQQVRVNFAPETLEQSATFNQNQSHVDGNWHTAAMTYNPITKKSMLAINGEIVTYGYYSTTSPQNSNIRIGRFSGSAQNFVGDIDDVKLFNRTFNSEELKSITQ